MPTVSQRAMYASSQAFQEGRAGRLGMERHWAAKGPLRWRGDAGKGLEREGRVGRRRACRGWRERRRGRRSCMVSIACDVWFLEIDSLALMVLFQ